MKGMICTLMLCAAFTSYAQTCNNPEGVNGMAAAVANSLAIDTERLDALTDLTIANDRLVFSEIGKQRCQSLRGCANTLALLSMQEDSVSRYISSTVFNPVIFRQRMVIQYQRQQIAAMRPNHDPNRAWAPPHTLQLRTTTMTSECGVHFWYKALNLNGGRTNATPANFCSQLIFAGAQGMMNGDRCVAENPYLDMRTVATADSLMIAIDPIEQIANISPAPIAQGQVIEACFFVDGQRSAQGVACNCSGRPGILQQVQNQSPLYTCSSAIRTFESSLAYAP